MRAAAEADPAAARPRIHFTPQANWMNDPNGLIFHDGLYHLYFQYNPLGADHGNMSWGHATSADLVSWREHPVALLFDEHEQVFSGSMVSDAGNTSGLGTAEHPPLVAVYTSARSDGLQAQSLAVSLDGGYTWEKYAGNPVLDRGSADFRDPKVFRYAGADDAYWVMVAVEAAERRVLFYRSDDLLSWTYLSDYGPAGAVGGVWECPDLFPLPYVSGAGSGAGVRWVLLVSLYPGGVAGGSATQYVVGEFDGIRFVPDVAHPCVDADAAELDGLDWVDLGPDCYAGVTFAGLPTGQRTLIAWMSNWDYAKRVPTSPWRGAMTTARRLALRCVDGRARLVSTPVLGREDGVLEGVPAGGSVDDVLPEAARIDLEVDGAAMAEVRLGDAECCVVVTVSGAERFVRVDRRRAVFEDVSDAQGVQRAALPAAAVQRVTIVVDNGSVEVFAGEGLVAVTALTSLPPAPGLHLTATGAVRLGVAELGDSGLRGAGLGGSGS